MKGLFRNIALYSVLMAFILLMGERVVPHHHCSGVSHSGKTLSYTHFGYGECDECGHSHGCDGHGHKHDEEQCCDGSEYYSRQGDNGTELCKKFPVQPLVCFAVPSLVPSSPQNENSKKETLYILKIPDRGVMSASLRAPPVA